MTYWRWFREGLQWEWRTIALDLLYWAPGHEAQD